MKKPLSLLVPLIPAAPVEAARIALVAGPRKSQRATYLETCFAFPKSLPEPSDPTFRLRTTGLRKACACRPEPSYVPHTKLRWRTLGEGREVYARFFSVPSEAAGVRRRPIRDRPMGD